MEGNGRAVGGEGWDLGNCTDTGGRAEGWEGGTGGGGGGVEGRPHVSQLVLVHYFGQSFGQNSPVWSDGSEPRLKSQR